MGQSEAEAKAKRSTVPPLDGVPEPLRPLLTRMLEPEPNRRIGSIDDVLAEARALAAPAPEAGKRRMGRLWPLG
jgi:serine/threonine-protein kinase